MAVPLLPPHHIEAMFELLLQQTFEFTYYPRNRQLNKFKHYIRSTWMSIETQELSVFGLERRTNNDCESYHSRFNRLVGGPHKPNCWDFAEYCNEMLEIQRHEYEKLKTNPHVPIVRERRAALVNRDARLRREERNLINFTITPMEFLDKFTHSADGIIERAIQRRREANPDESATSDEEDDDTIIEREEDPIIQPNVNGPQPHDLCLSCNQHCAGDKFILDCGQQPFCSNCTENILAVDHATCPACNQHVTRSIQIRNQIRN